jgi:ElaB/YqjD/DUF883 family membrane-anchored ribosome-binding protein
MGRRTRASAPTRILHAVRERAVTAAGAVAGTAVEPKVGARKLVSAMPWRGLGVAGMAFATGFLAGRQLRNGLLARGRDAGAGAGQ